MGIFSKPKTFEEKFSALQDKFINRGIYFMITKEHSGLTELFMPLTSPTDSRNQVKVITRDVSSISTELSNSLLSKLDNIANDPSFAAKRYEDVKLPDISARGFRVAATHTLDSFGLSGKDIGEGSIFHATAMVAAEFNSPSTLLLKQWVDESSNKVSYKPLFDFQLDSIDSNSVRLLTSTSARYVNTMFLQLNWVKGDIESAVAHLVLPSDAFGFYQFFVELDELEKKNS
jgi:hypothetical protein